MKKQQEKLTKQLLQEKIKQPPNQHNIDIWQEQLLELENYRAQGTVTRSKEKIIIKEEKPSKFFYSQEKQKQIKKQIKKLQKGDKIITSEFEILQQCHDYYQKLYKKSNVCDVTQKNLLQNIPNKITQQQNEILIKQINENKLKQGIFQMENYKYPAIDGLPIEYYKEFYEYLKDDLLQLYNNILFIEKQSLKTMNRAIITLIPKKSDTNDPSLNDLKN